MKTNKRSIKWQRLLFLFWGSILLLTPLIINETFSTSTAYIATVISDKTQNREYEGAEGCKICHSDYYNKWLGTNHAISAEAEDLKPNNPAYRNGECYSCHAGSTAGADIYGITATNSPVGSKGFHNPDEIISALEQLRDDCDEVIQLSQTAVNEPSILLLFVLGLSITLIDALLNRHHIT